MLKVLLLLICLILVGCGTSELVDRSDVLAMSERVIGSFGLYCVDGHLCYVSIDGYSAYGPVPGDWRAPEGVDYSSPVPSSSLICPVCSCVLEGNPRVL